MKYLQVTLEPIEYFFFGGEKHDADLKTNYFVRSGIYPQQTALLGLFRYYCLLKNPEIFNNNKIMDSDAAADLIGSESFRYPDVTSFGKLLSLSPLYFLRGDEKYFFAPFDAGFELDDDFLLSRSGVPFNAKEHGNDISGKLFCQGKKEMVELEGIIEDVYQTGNEKSDTGEAREEAYYKQVFKRFTDKAWRFAFDVTVDAELTLDDEHIYIPFGGEKCVFKLDIKNVTVPTSFVYPLHLHTRNCYAAFCISDSFIDAKLLNTSDFTVSRFVSFRNFRSTTKTRNYDAMKKNGDEIESGQVRSSRYNLLQRGSVIYFKNKESATALSNAIKNQPSSSIGFNHILINK